VGICNEDRFFAKSRSVGEGKEKNTPARCRNMVRVVMVRPRKTLSKKKKLGEEARLHATTPFLTKLADRIVGRRERRDRQRALAEVAGGNPRSNKSDEVGTVRKRKEESLSEEDLRTRPNRARCSRTYALCHGKKNRLKT